jgi:hypothetical protein
MPTRKSTTNTVAVDEITAGALIALEQRPLGQYVNRRLDQPWIQFPAIEPVTECIAVLNWLPRERRTELLSHVPRRCRRQAARRVEAAYREVR